MFWGRNVTTKSSSSRLIDTCLRKGKSLFRKDSTTSNSDIYATDMPTKPHEVTVPAVKPFSQLCGYPFVQDGGKWLGINLWILEVGQSSRCRSCVSSTSSACPVARPNAVFRPLTEPQGRLIFVSSIARSVSARCLLIHPDASCSEPNLPKYLVVPLGHLICTRQRSPFFTDVKMVLAPPMDTIIAIFNQTGKP